MTAVFLQVRIDSSRLPGKALADLNGATLTDRCVAALAPLAADRKVLVTEPASAPLLAPAARAAGWDLFEGSKDHVLDRFVQAARKFGVTTIVRATGDNPLVSARLAALLLDRHRALDSDYSGFTGLPVGTGVEVLSVRALEEAWGSGPDAYEREHVSPFLYRRPDRFQIDRPDAPAPCLFPEGRVTVDTAEDLSYLRALWTDLDRGKLLEVEDLIPWLTAHPR